MENEQLKQTKLDSQLLHRKKRLYFNEFNVLMDNATYLPLSSGLLRAYAETSELLRTNYDFMPFIFYRDHPDRILDQYDNPDVAAFSVSMWNEQLCLRVAEQVKNRYADCLIIFGGPNVPHYPQDYFHQHPFVDVAVRGEGEEAFSEILTRSLDSQHFNGIFGVSWRHPETGICVRNEGERPQARDMDVYPSPYLEGLFEELIDSSEGMEFQQIIETNRGCPFLCTFCFWGQGGLSRKYRFHSIDHVSSEIEWGAKHKIKYVFNADSNFGMHKRDSEIATMLVNTKIKYGYPEKFRTCFGKNTDEQIYKVAKILHEHDLEKGITLAVQSNDEDVLKNVKRENIKLSTYHNLQKRFNESNIPVYCELILGLPGETYQSWTTGIDDLLKAGLKNQLIVYMCQVFANTDLHDPEYRKNFGIVTHRIPLAEIHGEIRPAGLVTEYEDIIITTDSMPLADWRRMAVFSWVAMLLHSMKLGFFVLYYLHDRHGINHSDLISYIAECRMPAGTGQTLREEVLEFESQLDCILKGHGRGRALKEFGNIYWDEEEASFLRISSKLDQFYDELSVLVREFMGDRGIAFDEDELEEVIQYQRLRIPTYYSSKITKRQFNFNVPEYCETCFQDDAQPLVRKPQVLTIPNPKDHQGNKVAYARENILWGRKSGTMLVEVSWCKEVLQTSR